MLDTDPRRTAINVTLEHLDATIRALDMILNETEDGEFDAARRWDACDDQIEAARDGIREACATLREAKRAHPEGIDA